ncbi:hypothetical protein EVAR_16683_1 [Eumeta japonica]|uniref:Uncharacterized protein n=1 Tax=Eumeta variegata TaxID=151549 RepID=A0A4C1V5X0_EUMVA|nr:hypothetical protein EVAR_16683_1 [Eumeta japonica]
MVIGRRRSGGERLDRPTIRVTCRRRVDSLQTQTPTDKDKLRGAQPIVGGPAAAAPALARGHSACAHADHRSCPDHHPSSKKAVRPSEFVHRLRIPGVRRPFSVSEAHAAKDKASRWDRIKGVPRARRCPRPARPGPPPPPPPPAPNCFARINKNAQKPATAYEKSFRTANSIET